MNQLLSPDKVVEEEDYKVYLPQEVADELKEDIGQKLLDLMINGVLVDTLEYDEETAVYQDAELKNMIKFVRNLLRDDKKELMPADVTTEDKEFLYSEAKEWFEDLYDYVPEEETDVMDMPQGEMPEILEPTSETEAGEIDLGPVTEGTF